MPIEGKLLIFLLLHLLTRKWYPLNKDNFADKPYGFGSTNRRFPHAKRQKASIAKDRFAFDQAMQGNDCEKLLRGGDFVVQKRDFFGETDGKPILLDVKSGGSGVTEAQKKLKRQSYGRYRVVRY